jgi:predicted RNA-binding protein YlxR (DUF448 family)
LRIENATRSILNAPFSIFEMTQAKKKGKGPRPKHVPQRTCITCRRTDAKRGLIRLVRDAEGHVAPDPTGKRAGRGAYLCHNPTCWEQALKRHGLARALRLDVLSPDDAAALEQVARGLTAPQPEAL